MVPPTLLTTGLSPGAAWGATLLRAGLGYGAVMVAGAVVAVVALWRVSGRLGMRAECMRCPVLRTTCRAADQPSRVQDMLHDPGVADSVSRYPASGASMAKPMLTTSSHASAPAGRPK